MVPTIEVEALEAELKGPVPPLLLDVREDTERAKAALPGAVAIPLREIPARAAEELESARRIVVFCHRGGRSAQAAAWLLRNGFKEVLNLDGGIDAWSRRVDGSVPLY